MSDIWEEHILAPELDEPELQETDSPPPEPLPVQPERPAAKRKKVPLTCRTWAKVTAFIMAVVMVCVCGLSVLAAVVMVHEDIYSTPKREYLDIALGNMARSDGHNVANLVLLENDLDGAREYLKYRNVARVEISLADKKPSAWWIYADGGMNASEERIYERKFNRWKDVNNEEYLTFWTVEGQNLIQTGTVTVWLADEFVEQDDYFFAEKLISAAYYFRYSVYVIIGVSAVLAIACFIFLLCASGKHPDHEGVRPGWGTKIPVDALTVGTGFAAFLIAQLIVEAGYSDNVTMVVVWTAGTLALLTMFFGWCMSFALRLKLGGWWKNSVCWWCLRLCFAVSRALWRFLCACGRGLKALIMGIPLVWKVLVVYALVSFVEFLILAMCYWRTDLLMFWWFVETCVLLPIVLAIALMLRKLERGGKAIAEGDLNHQIDTKKLLPVFRRHAQNLNCIGEGMTRAVEERTKSERMKTELITNVSHDIKTPLTSIINYADLIEKEPCENEKITEYAQVLHRQSDRLKRLIDDLVEASKASTGNLEINLAPCEVGVLITQTAGEYEHRLRECGLELITRQPDKPVKIMADGRRLWRVFDNLMNNVCKYAQEGTRVYLTLEKFNGQAVISIKNTSHEALNLTPDELMERFVRGDSSRKSEGNGLGLSIARSLTELQRGKLELTTDGDLFKVVLKFPLIP